MSHLRNQTPTFRKREQKQKNGEKKQMNPHGDPAGVPEPF
jgi:hypothetical protein